MSASSASLRSMQGDSKNKGYATCC